MPPDSLVVTLQCAGASWNYCEQLREQHFPPNRNLVPAHIAMFHHLPAEQLTLAEEQARAILSSVPRFGMRVSRLRSLGRGVALQVESDELLQLHRSLAAIWRPWLIPQDLAKFSPHITIQNKVTAEVARETLRTLQVTFAPFEIEASGVEFWYYDNGPWRPAAFVPFRDSVSPSP